MKKKSRREKGGGKENIQGRDHKPEPTKLNFPDYNENYVGARDTQEEKTGVSKKGRKAH